MTHYTAEDIRTISDPIALLRQKDATYGGKKPRGPRFAARMLHDLILLGALPAQVDKVNEWWTVWSEKDWLSVGGKFSTDPFSWIVPFPIAGDNTHRTEVLLTAFCEAVLTCDQNGCVWIAGSEKQCPMPDGLTSKISAMKTGRLIAFKIDDDVELPT